MRKLFYISFLWIFLSNNAVGQDFTEKYNSLHERYEFYDSNNNLIGYKKYNTLYQRWDYYDLKSNSNVIQPINPIDWNLTYQALSIAQQRYDYNKQYVVETITKLLDNIYNNPSLSQNEKKLLLDSVNNAVNEINSKGSSNFLDNNVVKRILDYVFQCYNVTVENINVTRKNQTQSSSTPYRPKSQTKSQPEMSINETNRTVGEKVPELNDLLSNIKFTPGSSEISKSFYEYLNLVATHLKKNTGKYEIQVFTDDVGQDVQNLKLSQERANSIRNYLINKGAPAEGIIAVGYGENFPKYDNKTAEGRSKNRRVEIVKIH